MQNDPSACRSLLDGHAFEPTIEAGPSESMKHRIYMYHKRCLLYFVCVLALPPALTQIIARLPSLDPFRVAIIAYVWPNQQPVYQTSCRVIPRPFTSYRNTAAAYRQLIAWQCKMTKGYKHRQ